LNEIKIFSGQQKWAFVGLDQQAKLFWSTKIMGSEVYGCPEDMPVNRGLLMEPKRSLVQGLWMSRGHAC
jgi:hypothetical protein